MIVEFEIPRIQPKERPRVAYASRTIYTPRKTTDYESEVRFIYNITCGHVFEGAVKVEMTFMMHRPKTVKREYPSVIPDLDNLVKSTMDGLNPHTDGYNRTTKGAWLDDGQVVEIHATKVYTDGEDKTIVRIEDVKSDM